MNRLCTGAWAVVAGAVLGAALTSGGCVAAAGAAAGYGAWEYNNGEYVGVCGATFDRAWQATQEALAGMGMSITSAKRERLRGEVRAKLADGTGVEVDLSPQSSDFTRLTVRVGVFGDEIASKRIVSKIKERL
jgi:uncharacterized lipoprotein